MSIPFNKPYLTGTEFEHISQALISRKLSGDGEFTFRCQSYFEKRFNFAKSLLTTSCTDALEMASILCDIKPGDEVIAPSYTFVSTVNAFALRGAKIIFADSSNENPNLDVEALPELISNKTKAIIPVHYAGVACDMGPILSLAKEYGLYVIEDAAQAFDSFYKGKSLGSLGQFSTFSFHETKNIICGEGGMLVVNDEKYIARAEIIREKGTNRSAFFRGEVDKYGWVDIGSSFLPSDILASMLYAQFLESELIQKRRVEIWQRYWDVLNVLNANALAQLPNIPEYATNNGHMFYLVCRNVKERGNLISYLKENGIQAVFHYQSLHKSRFFEGMHDDRVLGNADRYTDCLLRLPLYFELENEQIDYIATCILQFYGLAKN